MIIVGWPYTEFEDCKKDIEGSYLKAIRLAPEFAERVRNAKREARFLGAAVPNYFRKPYGPGWALVGDAGYNRDFITGQGMMDAFHDAELCAAALDKTFSGAQPFDAANIARVIALRAGVPKSKPAMTVHRNCASGLESLTTAAERAAAGHGEVFIVGGTESMSQVPLLFKPAAAAKFAGLARAKSPGEAPSHRAQVSPN